MSARLKGRRHIIFAMAFAVLAAVAALWGGQWQAKDYKGRGLGLFVADGDTITTGYIEADTVHSDIDSTALLFVHSDDDGRGYAWFSNPSLATATGFYGVYGDWTKTGGASDQNDQYAGFTFHAELDQPGGGVGSFTGFQGYSWLTNGQVGSPDTNRFMIGGKSSAQLYGGTVYGTVIGHYGEAVSTGSADSVSGNLMGVYSYTQAYHVGGTAYNIYMHDDTGTDYGIYQTGTSPNYLWGLDLGDSLTVAGNVHAANIYGDSLFGDGSNLTGVSGSGADTTGLREEWRQDISDSLAAGGPGGTSDHGELDSLSLLDDDHPQYLLRADFPDSFATAWPDSFAAAMTDQIRPAIHDTAEVVRAAIRDTVSAIGQRGMYSIARGVIDSITTTSVTNGNNLYYDATGPNLYVACKTSGIVSFSVANGVPTPVDTVTEPSVSVWGITETDGGKYLFSVYKGVARSYSLASGVMTLVDTVSTLPDSAMSIHCTIQNDTTWVYSSNDDGEVNTLTSIDGDLTLKTTKVANNSGVGYDIWSNGANVYLANREYGIYSYTNAGGTLTQKTNWDPGADWALGVWGDGDWIYAAVSGYGICTLSRNGDGTVTFVDKYDPGDYSEAVWSAGAQVWYGTAVIFSGFYQMDVDDYGNIAAVDRTVMADFSSNGNTMDGDGEWLFFLSGGKVYSYRYSEPWAYDPGTLTHSFDGAMETDSSALFGGNVSIDVDGTPTAKAYNLSVYDGAAYSRLDAGSDWTTSSSRKLKQTNGVLGPGLGGAVLEAISRMPIYWWKWKRGDTDTQHVGPVAEDFYEVGKLVAPRAATDSTIAGEHEVAALFIAVKELARRNDSLGVALAASERRMANLERAWGARDSTGTKPRRPRLDKPPERPQPDRRRRP